MSVFGFDFGNHSSYVAMVKSGGIDTVDDEYSYRATPTLVSFTDHMRLVGNSARSKVVTNFKNTFSSFKNLIGLSYDDPSAQEEMTYVPAKFVKMPDGTVGIEASYLGEPVQFGVVQLVGMMLSGLHATALSHASCVASCVINAPIYFTDSQRRALLDACTIGGFKPSTIISDCAAVCSSYVLFKTDLPADTENPRNVAFVNIGYSSTQVCIAAFNRDNFRILSSIGTTEIGGRTLDGLLFDKFCNDFSKSHKRDVRTSPKATFKLLTQCEAVKKQINTTTAELPVKIECFMDDIDFTSKTSREEFDSLSAPVYSGLKQLFETALSNSGVKKNSLHSVETVGGTTRILGVRSVIASAFGKSPSTTLNADEAVARGCAIQAALSSHVVRMRPLDTKDRLCSRFCVQFVGKKGDKKEIEVFKFGETIPSTRKITFGPNDNFSFEVVETSMSGMTRLVSRVTAVGKSASECNAENLFFSVDLSSSSIFSVERAGFVENCPSEQPTENGKSTGEQTPEKAKHVIHELSLEVVYAISNAKNIEKYVQIEKDLLQQVKLERDRATSKNSLEEFIYSVREKIDSFYRPFMTEHETEDILRLLSQEQDWLYCDGDFESAKVYTERLEALHHEFQPVYARSEGFSRGFDTLQALSVAVAKYRKFLDVYSQDPAKYDFITPEEYNTYSQKVIQADTFAIQSIQQLNGQPKTRLPFVSHLDIEQKLNELRGACDPILKKAENPPPKPPPPTPEADTPEADTQLQQPAEPQVEVEPTPTENQ